jgi:hypothetical protein
VIKYIKLEIISNLSYFSLGFNNGRVGEKAFNDRLEFYNNCFHSLQFDLMDHHTEQAKTGVTMCTRIMTIQFSALANNAVDAVTQQCSTK